MTVALFLIGGIAFIVLGALILFAIAASDSDERGRASDDDAGIRRR